MSYFRVITMCILVFITAIKSPGSLENLLSLIGLFLTIELYEIKK